MLVVMQQLVSYTGGYVEIFATLWVLVELVFYVAIRLLASSVNELTTPATYNTCPEKLVRRILDNVDNMKTYDIYSFFSGWFMGVELSEIHEDNFRSFLAWVLFAKVLQDVTQEEMMKLDNTATHIYDRMSWTPPTGFNKSVRHVGMTVEEISYTHRPLFIYVLVYLKNVFTTIIFHFFGFQSRQLKAMHYWHRGSSSANLEPLIFFHGITTGWGVYFGLIQALVTNRAVFLFDFEAIKLFSLCFELPSPEAYCTSVKEVLDLHKVKKVNVIGHSFGTITAAWFVDHCPEHVSHLTLVDPVSLLLAHPDVAYNFLYRPPSNFIEWMIYYGASQEITIANCLRRNFWWYNNVLWLEDVPPGIGVHVSLAAADQVSNTTTIEEYIKTCAEHRRQNFKHDQIMGNEVKSTASSVGANAGDRASSQVADICYSIRQGHSHAQILMSRSTLLELAFLVHSEYKKCDASSCN